MAGNKGLLSFVGLGLRDEKGITVRGLEELRRADAVFAEAYTSTLTHGALDRLAESAGKKIELLTRAEVEDGKKLLEEAAGKHVVLLVAGDPMSATTHVDLRLRAKSASIDTVVIHGVSIMAAVPGLR